MLTISTSRITYSGSDRLDITIKSASTIEGKLFAPTWEMVTGVKAYHGDTRFPNVTPISSEEYDQRYYQLLRERYAKNKQLFIDLIHRESVVLCCFCNSPENCHRRLAADILSKLAAHHSIAVKLGGESDRETSMLITQASVSVFLQQNMQVLMQQYEAAFLFDIIPLSLF
jgi:hypothetical protein